jgi:hypothetical protein
MFLDYIIQIYASKSSTKDHSQQSESGLQLHRCRIGLGCKLLAIVQFQGLNLEPSCEIQLAIWPTFVILYRRDGLQNGEMKIFLVSHYLRLVPQWCINCGEQKALLVLISYLSNAYLRMLCLFIWTDRSQHGTVPALRQLQLDSSGSWTCCLSSAHMNLKSKLRLWSAR